MDETGGKGAPSSPATTSISRGSNAIGLRGLPIPVTMPGKSNMRSLSEWCARIAFAVVAANGVHQFTIMVRTSPSSVIIVSFPELPASDAVRVIVLPQALRIAVPPLTNTSIVFNSAKAATADPAWTGFFAEVYVFVAAIYFVISLSISWSSISNSIFPHAEHALMANGLMMAAGISA